MFSHPVVSVFLSCLHLILIDISVSGGPSYTGLAEDSSVWRKRQVYWTPDPPCVRC